MIYGDSIFCLRHGDPEEFNDYRLGAEGFSRLTDSRLALGIIVYLEAQVELVSGLSSRDYK